MKHLTAALAALALAACGDTEPADEASRNAASVEPVPAAPLAGSEPQSPSPAPGDDGTLGTDEVAQGQWYAKTERGIPMALFGPPQTEANFVVRCEGEQLVFVRGLPIEGEQADMTLMAGGETRTVTARARPGPLPQTTARLPASDAFARVLARTTEPIAVAVGAGGEPYRMPSSAALRSVVSECMAG